MLAIEDGTSSVLLDESPEERNAVISDDGRWLAYDSDETGRREVYVRPFPDVHSGRWQVSTEGGSWPLWNPAGGELLYRGPDGVMALRFDDEPTFTPGALTELFDWGFIGGGPRRMAISRDGEQFLLLKDSEQSESGNARRPQITVILNWFQELTERVPSP